MTERERPTEEELVEWENDAKTVHVRRWYDERILDLIAEIRRLREEIESQ